MELVLKHAFAGELRNVVSLVVWSVPSSSSAAAAGGRRSCEDFCRKLPPRIALVAESGMSKARGRADGRVRASWKCVSVDRVVPIIGKFRRGDHCGEFACRRASEVGELVRRGGLAVVKRKCSRLAMPRPNSEEGVDLELDILRFMQQSSKPNAFPTKEDLIAAGRMDLVRAIKEGGGWLAAGWEEPENSTHLVGVNSTSGSSGAAREVGICRPLSRGKSSVRSSKRSSKAGKSSGATLMRVDPPCEITSSSASDVASDTVDTSNGDTRRISKERMNFKTGGNLWDLNPTLESVQPSLEEESKGYGLRSSNTSTEAIESLFRFTGDLKLKKPQNGKHFSNLNQASARDDRAATYVANEVLERTPSNTISNENVSLTESVDEALMRKVLLDKRHSDVQDSGDGFAGVTLKPKMKRKKKKHQKKEREKVISVQSTDREVNGALDWINQMVDQREKWMLETRPNSSEQSSGTSPQVNPRSMQDRIRTLEAKLVYTRAALQSRRQALWQTGDSSPEVHQQNLSEVTDAEDTLEFRENAIMHAHSELSSTRAEITALEGRVGSDIIEARKTLEENEKRIEKARTALKSLWIARIVWPNPGREVFLTGSFDGWKNQVKMEKSSAGVFVVSLPLHPGRFEIKFVVDGSWRVDTNRPIVYVGGYENNLLTVS